MRKTFHFPVDEDVYESVTETIRTTLSKNGKSSRNILRIMLSAEESLVRMLEHRTEPEGEVKLVVSRFLGTMKAILSCTGDEFELFTNSDIGWDDHDDEMGEMSQEAIREILLNRFSQNLTYRHRKGVNTVTIKGEQGEYTTIFVTLGCLALGVLFGFAMKYLMGDAVATGIETYALDPIRTMFLSALSILVGPVVFFSMVCCISNFGSLRDIGKMGVRILLMYLLTTTLAVGLGFAAYHVFPVGDPSLLDKAGGSLEANMDKEELDELTEAVEKAEGGVSIVDTVVGIVSNNIVAPFMENNLLQLIFLGVFMGIGISSLQDKHPELRSFFVSFCDLFMSMLELLCKLIPLAVFCNMACLVYTTGTDVLMSILSYVLLCAGAILCMIVVYHVLIMLLAGLNPLVFARRYLKVMLTALTLSSSTAALPVSMEECEKMGISKKVVSLSLPLGSSINMDGSSLVMSIICLFMASIYGIELTPSLMVTILVSIILLSLGAPSMAGADLAIIVVLLAQIGVPPTAIALIMGVDTILDMMQAMCNTTGDAAIALIIAKRHGELDTSMYK